MCECHKLLTFSIEDFSFDQRKFENFLVEIRACCGDEKVFLFLDNATIHRCSVKKMAELNIEPVWNVPYSPEYNNAVERFWAQLKSYFRPLPLKKMLLNPRAKDNPLKDAVRQTMREVSRDSIPAFCQSGLAALSRDAERIKHERKLAEFSHVASVGSPKMHE